MEKENLSNLNIEGNKEKILEVKNLKTFFFTEEGVVKAVDGISFDMYMDEVLGLVGETGCGKSVTALSILKLIRKPGKIVEGTIKYRNLNLLDLSKKEIREYRGKNITMIFQDPLNSLNPVITVGDQIKEVFLLHQTEEMQSILEDRIVERHEKVKEIKNIKKQLKQESLPSKEIFLLNQKLKKLKSETRYIPQIKDILEEKSIQIIKEVGIADPEGILDRYPYELSGGMRQRIMIAMALSCNPSLLIADEPTTALDVTIQAQILDLLKELKNKFKTSILLITHDLGIIAEMCDRVAVMYSGNIVEYATADDLFNNPRHPYTKGLIEAIPTLEKKQTKLKTIRGTVPNLIYPPSGCRFHPRCDYRLEVCDKVKPKLTKIDNTYFVACHLFDADYNESPKYEWRESEKEKVSLI